MSGVLQDTWKLWLAGGWLMVPLALLGGVIYFAIFDLYLRMRKISFYKVDPNQLGHWVDVPKDASGEVANILSFAQNGIRNSDMMRNRFEELRMTYLPNLERRVLFCTILVGAAPLTGLLGTVVGMLSTFFGMSVSSGGNTIDLVAGGISEALITTQTGLILAIPAYVVISMVKRQIEELNQFFTRVEILSILKFEKKQSKIPA